MKAVLPVAAVIVAYSRLYAESPGLDTPRIAELNAMLQQNPTSTYVLEERAHAFALLGQRERAIEDLRRAVELKPDDYVLLRHAGWTVFNLREFKLAFGFWQRSGDLCQYDSSPSNYTMALGYWSMKDLTTAAYYYDRAVAMEKAFGKWDTLQNRVSFWTDFEKKAIYEVFDAWRRGYKTKERRN